MTTAKAPPSPAKNLRGQRRSPAARLPAKKHASPPPDDAKKPRGTDVRERILQAALECFGAFGFEGTSTRAVAERAGTTHSLLLYHFESKDKLWRETMADVVGRYRAEFEQRLQLIDRNDPAAGLRAFIENFVRFSARVPQLHRIMTMESTQGSERIDWLIEAHIRASFNHVRDLIHRGQAAGKVRNGDTARLYYAIIGLAGTLLSVSTEFKLLTGHDVFTEGEMCHTIGFICDFIFV
ncbi:MAG: TetR/AcrR family transcriptional regulator [Rhodocyclaceae bacterium]|nr:TetR/AcrR family transcriptional regulator [Rhodocyclaceae bacterium]